MKQDTIIDRLLFASHDLRHTIHQLAQVSGIDPSNFRKALQGEGTISQSMIDKLTDQDTVFQRGNTLVRINRGWLLGDKDWKGLQYTLVSTSYKVRVRKA